MNSPRASSQLSDAQRLMGTSPSRDNTQKAIATALIVIAEILDEMAGPYCGHGDRRSVCQGIHEFGQ